jgi:hypothetical protein
MKGASLAYPFRPLSHQRPNPLHRTDDRPVETGDWASVEDDIEIVRQTRANVLVTGPEFQVTKVTRRLVADASAVVGIPCQAKPLPFFPLPVPRAIVLFRDIDTLDAEGQALLLQWLESVTADQIIVSTASGSLLAAVDAGTFDPQLYYRLNTVYIKLGE